MRSKTSQKDFPVCPVKNVLPPRKHLEKRFQSDPVLFVVIHFIRVTPNRKDCPAGSLQFQELPAKRHQPVPVEAVFCRMKPKQILRLSETSGRDDRPAIADPGIFTDNTGNSFVMIDTAARIRHSDHFIAGKFRKILPVFFCLPDDLVLLKQGQIRSCGCLQKEARKNQGTHGMSDTRLFYVWNNMKNRCNWKKHKDYHNYGGRGIRVCDEWLHDFGAFASWALANGYDENAPYGACTLDRIDPDKDYEPSNCRFADSFVQANNRRDRHLKGELVQDERGVFHVADTSSEVA